MPVSARKQAANQANARKSTGPKTAEGKAISSRNACHYHNAPIGMLVSLRSENIADLHAIRAAMAEQYAPANIQELQLIEVISNAYVRLQRAEEMSTALLDGTMEAIQKRNGIAVADGLTAADALGCSVALSQKDTARTWEIIERYRTRATLDYHRALNALSRVQAARLEAPVRECALEIRAADQQLQIEKRRRLSIAVTEHVLTRPNEAEETNEPISQPATSVESTPVASFSQTPRSVGVLPFPIAVTTNRVETVQSCNNRKAPITSASIPPNRAQQPDSNRK